MEHVLRLGSTPNKVRIVSSDGACFEVGKYPKQGQDRIK
jgi:hypothetical protein